MTSKAGNPSAVPLPVRAKWIFAVTAVMVSACFLSRRPGMVLQSWQKWLLDVPMLVMVALSSLIWATYRRGLAEPIRTVSDELDANTEEIHE